MFSSRQSGLRALLHRKAQMIPEHTAWQSEGRGSSQIKLWRSSFQNLSVLICCNYKVPWRRPTWQRRKLNLNWNNATITHYDLSSNIAHDVLLSSAVSLLRNSVFPLTRHQTERASWKLADASLTPRNDSSSSLFPPLRSSSALLDYCAAEDLFLPPANELGIYRDSRNDGSGRRWGGDERDKKQNTTGKPEGYFGNSSLLVDVTPVHIYPANKWFLTTSDVGFAAFDNIRNSINLGIKNLFQD